MKTDNINDKEWQEELNNAPGLFNRREDQPFEAPAGYFDNLAAGIIVKIKAAERTSKEAVIRPLFTSKRFLISSIAIAAVLIILFIFGRIRNEENKMIAMNYDDIYNSGLVSELDETLLMETLAEENTLNINSNSSEIENYLIESSTEEALLNNL